MARGSREVVRIPIVKQARVGVGLGLVPCPVQMGPLTNVVPAPGTTGSSGIGTGLAMAVITIFEPPRSIHPDVTEAGHGDGAAGHEFTPIRMMMLVVAPYRPVKSSTVVKWMTPSRSFARILDAGGCTGVRGDDRADVDAVDLDRARQDEPEDWRRPPAARVVTSSRVALVMTPSVFPALQRNTSPK